ncbi:ABC transporter permease [Antarcticirhabdus aurantiaca]|uniref:ABC transporter permease n=1 Tax=Antarcticirhabdus aurantiaca TaxID=2606717 RepID=A0ACD4NPD2_9HYPH|nr:ABC transporter permease [Antarcticirhabdus aurantiaca]WAJ28565.1 ABC transporter permease [Jeongeuplla avenae]
MSETTGSPAAAPPRPRGPSDFEAAAARETRVAEFESRTSGLARLQHFLHANPTMVPVLVLAVSVAIFGVLLGQRFFSLQTLNFILQQVTIVGIIGVAQTLVILTAGIDLSVGAIAVLSSVVMGQFAVRLGLPVPLAIACGLALGTFCGFVNGYLVSRLKLPPFIVTLGTWSIFLAANFIYSANETIRATELAESAPLLQFFGQTFRIFGATFSYGAVFMVLLVLLVFYILNNTAWGRHVYAIGDDQDAARLSGISVSRTLISVYAASGLICALAGWALIGRIGSVSPTSGQEANIQSITAVVIGGTSLFGGRGSVFGTLIGALIVGVFAMGLRIWGTDPQWTQLTVGALIILSVAADQWIRKVSA